MSECERERECVTHKKVDEMLIAGICFKGEFKDSAPRFETLLEKCRDIICGPAMAIYDYGVYTDGTEVEASFPVKTPFESDEIKSRILESAEVLSVIHYGPHDNVRESYRKLFGYFAEHGIVGTNLVREIYSNCNPQTHEENVTEIQAVLHKWGDRLARNVDRVLGVDAQKEIMQTSDSLFTLESTRDERAQWVKAAMQKLDELADNHQKYDILSRCAHDFSGKRIDKLRVIYEKNKDIDEVLKEMHKDPAWYEKPVRKQNILYVTKVPFDQKGYESAETESERKKRYCHCSLVREYLDEGISPTLCYCGSGWYRQQWEGILGKPVEIEILKSLLKGDNECSFAIHLPLEVVK